MQAGISTACLYPMLLEDSLSTLISMDFHLFEVFVNTCSELKEEYLKNLRHIAEDSGSTIKSVHPFTSGFESFLLFSSYKRRFYDGLEFYKKYFNACNILGADLLVLHGMRKDKRSISDEEYFTRYARLFALGKTFGVTVAQENVNAFCSDDPLFIRHMRDACGEDCAFVLDIKQAVRGGADPFQICKAMREKIVHIHINDNTPDSDCMLPGFGTMDYRKMIRQLKDYGFNGSLVIEVYRKSFGKLQELLSAKQVVEGLL